MCIKIGEHIVLCVAILCLCHVGYLGIVFFLCLFEIIKKGEIVGLC